MPTISSEERISLIEEQMADAIDEAKGHVSDEVPLVIAVHPQIDWFFKKMAGLDQDAELRGIAGVRNIMVTESVPDFRVIICNGNL